EWFPAHCVRQIGLRTDYRSEQRPPGLDAQPYPKDGLAIAPPQPIERIEIVSPDTAPAQVVEAFNEAEDKTIRQVGHAEWAHPYRRAQRETFDLSVEALYAVGDAATRIYYFEVSRLYPDRKRVSPCTSLSFGAGWFIREGTSPLRRLSFDAAVVACDRSDIRY